MKANKEDLNTTIEEAKNGDIIVLTDAIYKINSSLKIDKKITIQSKNKAQLVFTTENNTVAFKMHPYGNLILENIDIKGNNQVTFAHNSPVISKRLRKSVGKERTFNENIEDHDEMLDKLHGIIEKLAELLEKKNIAGKTITLKIKYHNFVVNTRSKTLDDYISTTPEMYNAIYELLRMPNFPEEPVRLLGVQLSNLNINKNKSRQLLLDF